MPSSKLTSLLRMFSPSEFKAFEAFIQSPISRSGKYVVDFFNVLKPDYPAFDSDKVVIYKRLYPKRPYNDVTMRKLVSELLTLAESFLAYTHFHNQPFEENFALLHELSTRKADSLFKHHAKQVARRIGQTSLDAEDFFFQNLRLTRIEDDFYSSSDWNKTVEKMQLGETYFESYLLIHSFKQYTQLATEQVSNNRSVSMPLADTLLRHVEANYDKLPATVRIFYHQVMLCMSQTETHYFQLKELVIQYHTRLSPNDRRMLYQTLVNFCALNINRGHQQFLQEEFKLYQLMLERKAWMWGNYMSVNMFTNIVTNGLKVGEYDYVKRFIETHGTSLAPAVRSDTVSFCLGNLNFYLKRFNDALQHLSKITSGDSMIKMNLKVLQLKVFYEMAAFEPALSLIDSHRHWLARDKVVTAEVKTIQLAFLKFTSDLIRLRTQGKKDAATLKEKIAASHAISKTWLLSKADELCKAGKRN
jgi:hypothetical protein